MLDLGLIRDSSAIDFDELPDPSDTCVEILTQLAKASDAKKTPAFPVIGS